MLHIYISARTQPVLSLTVTQGSGRSMTKLICCTVLEIFQHCEEKLVPNLHINIWTKPSYSSYVTKMFPELPGSSECKKITQEQKLQKPRKPKAHCTTKHGRWPGHPWEWRVDISAAGEGEACADKRPGLHPTAHADKKICFLGTQPSLTSRRPPVSILHEFQLALTLGPVPRVHIIKI